MADALRVAEQVAAALAAAHARGFVRRDLEPANVRLTPDGTAKALDFGIAKPVAVPGECVVTGTPAGMMLGSAGYMAPEQICGDAVDARADIFAFGCLFFEYLVGMPAFAGTASERLAGVLSRVAAPARRAPRRALAPRAARRRPRMLPTGGAPPA